jgi:DNA-binding NarL/FixJ family response regulator
MNQPRRILVVDDHTVVRRGAMDIIACALKNPSFLEAASTSEALRVLESQDCDLVVLDISLPDGNGLDLLERIVQHWPELPVIMLSVHNEAEYARKAMALGAHGYLGKNSAPEELAEAVAQVLAGERYVTPALSRTFFPTGPAQAKAALSRREQEVMRRLAQGERLSDIAISMGVSVKTASTYRARVMQKLGLKTTADFFHYVIKSGGFLG